MRLVQSFGQFFLLMYFISVLGGTPVYGQGIEVDIQEFRYQNPDGQKYEFVRDYLMSLSYIRNNAIRWNHNTYLSKEFPENQERVNDLSDHLIRDNLNLRITRNMIERYRTPENGLILKATDLVMKMCNQQIALNNKERKLYRELYEVFGSNDKKDIDRIDFLARHQILSNQRKESWKNLLKSSIFVTRVLISDQPDYDGELSSLGITHHQRRKLLSKLDEFYGEDIEAEITVGQTFLEASISAIKEVLDDYQWDTIDE